MLSSELKMNPEQADKGSFNSLYTIFFIRALQRWRKTESENENKNIHKGDRRS